MSPRREQGVKRRRWEGLAPSDNKTNGKGTQP
jgi:hypothetical protein